MTNDGDFDRTLLSWLEADAVAPAPAGLLDRVTGTTEPRKPRPGWLARLHRIWIGGAAARRGVVEEAQWGQVPARRFGPALLLVALVVLATSVVLVAGGGLLERADVLPVASQSGEPSRPPTPTPSPSPTLPISPSQTPWSATPSAEPLPSPIEHVVRHFRSPFIYVLPEGAEFEVGPSSSTSFELRIPAAAEAGHPAGLIVQVIGGGRTDPCSATSAAKPIVGGANSVIEYLREIPNLEILNESRVVVGREWAFQARVKTSPATSRCPDFWLWDSDTEPITAIPRGQVVRVIAVHFGLDRIVLTVYGEEENPWWGAMADELIGSFRYLLSESPPQALHPWLGAVRVEPSGAPTLVPVTDRGALLDPRGDGMPEAIDLVDFIWLSINVGCYGGPFCADFRIAETSPWSQFDPSLEWVAYGFMTDQQRDGVGDVMVGLDNVHGVNRAWTTDMDSGETTARKPIGSWAMVGGSVPWLVTGAPVASGGWLGADGPAWFSMETFYLWAAVVRDGQIVSVDYVPDVGWFTLPQP